MSSRPPREGARWGDDPAPEPAPTPQLPPLYVELRERFGEENLKRALSIQRLVKTEYPHLKVNELGELEFAADILAYTQHWVKFAAEDGRAKPMSKALQLLSEQVGSILKDNPDRLQQAKYMIYFGDEHKGSVAKDLIARDQKKHQNTENTKNIIFWGIPVVTGALGFIVAQSDPSAPPAGLIAIFTAVIGFFIARGIFYFIDGR